MPSPQDRYEAPVVDPSILGEQLKFPFSGLVAKNRFLNAAMTERLSSWDQHDLSKRGIPSPELIHLYDVWGKGGYGVILTGNTMVTPVDLEAAGNAIIYEPFETPERLAAFRAMAEAGKKNGSLMIVQLSHSGRQVLEEVNPNPVSASDVQLPAPGFAKPTPLTKEGIKDVINRFAYAAEFSYRTGFDGVQLHGAHGYLLAQFLSGTTNLRTDEYGGSLDNRARIILEIIDEIRRRVPDPKFTIGIKINSTEFQKGGFQPEECKEVCKKLEEAGLDFIELSGGTYEKLLFAHVSEKTKQRGAFFLDFADIIRPVLRRSLVYVTGGFKTAHSMVRAIQEGSAHGVGLGRAACAEPDLPNLILNGNVSSAKKTLLDPENFGETARAAGSQIRQVSMGEKPIDMSDPEAAKFFKEVSEKANVWMAENKKKGIVTVQSLNLENGGSLYDSRL